MKALRLTTVAPFVVSLIAHVGAVSAMSKIDPKERPKRERIEIALVKPKPKPKPPPPKPEPKPEPKVEPPKPKPKPKPKRAKKVKKAKPPPPEPPPEAPPPEPEAPEPPPDAPPPPPPVAFSVSMDATVKSGAVAVNAREGGGNMFGDPTKKGLPDGEQKSAPPPPRRRPKPKIFTEVDELPKCRRRGRPPYPRAAERLGIEARVVLSVVVDAKGRVTKARVVKKAGYGLDEAAIKWAKGMRCKPAKAAGQAVAVKHQIAFEFTLDD